VELSFELLDPGGDGRVVLLLQLMLLLLLYELIALLLRRFGRCLCRAGVGARRSDCCPTFVQKCFCLCLRCCCFSCCCVGSGLCCSCRLSGCCYGLFGLSVGSLGKMPGLLPLLIGRVDVLLCSRCDSSSARAGLFSFTLKG
jgi:hypothetical protein